jgi:hypothetical protein
VDRAPSHRARRRRRRKKIAPTMKIQQPRNEETKLAENSIMNSLLLGCFVV